MGYIIIGKKVPAQNLAHQKDLDLILLGLSKTTGLRKGTHLTWAPVQAGNGMTLVASVGQSVPVRRRSHPTLPASSIEQE